MAKIIHLDPAPGAKRSSDSLLKRMLRGALALLGAMVFVIFLPFFIISSIACSAANSFTYEVTGGYLMNISFRTGPVADNQSDQ
jgi:hypothetical protein